MKNADADDRTFRALADGTRRALLDLLADSPCSVVELTEHFEISQPAVSQHLKVLRDAKLVSERKVGRNRMYELDAEPLLGVRAWVDEHVEFWESRLAKLGDHLRRNHGE